MHKPIASLIHVLLIPAWLMLGVGSGGCTWSTPTAMPVVTPVATLTAETDGMTLVYVPAGEFLMGLTSADIDSILTQCKDCKREQFANEQPRHPVYLDAYWIDRTEVTNAMYAACVQAGTCQLPRLISSLKRSSYYGDSRYQDYPVIYVDWDQAATYCAWAGRRLPTEAEWEKAARGTDGRLYPWGNQAPDCNRANFDASSNNIKYCVGETQAVGSYPSGASPYGALDMAGNVWEWVSDWYDEFLYSHLPASNPSGPGSGEYRVVRGGAWHYLGYYMRSSLRVGDDPSSRFYNLGFRCARSQ